MDSLNPGKKDFSHDCDLIDLGRTQRPKSVSNPELYFKLFTLISTHCFHVTDIKRCLVTTWVGLNIKNYLINVRKTFCEKWTCSQYWFTTC